MLIIQLYVLIGTLPRVQLDIHIGSYLFKVLFCAFTHLKYRDSIALLSTALAIYLLIYAF